MAGGTALQARAEDFVRRMETLASDFAAFETTCEGLTSVTRRIVEETGGLEGSLRETQDGAGRSAELAKSAAAEAGAGDQQITQLTEAVKEITGFLTVIGAITSQTKLLSINASVEAARAGEQGRGFAVVASEVRSLADKTAEATSSIRQQIESLQKAVDGASASFGRISEQITGLNEIASQIADKVGAQSEGCAALTTAVKEANGEIDRVRGSAQRFAAGARDDVEAARSVAAMARGDAAAAAA